MDSENKAKQLKTWRAEIQELLTKISNLENPDQPAIVTDNVILYARRWFNTDGEAYSSVCYLVCNEGQPEYVSIGLLSMANDLMLDDFTSVGFEDPASED